MNTKVKNIITLIIAVAIPLVVGGVSAALTNGTMTTFNSVKKPPLSSPGWLFPIAWSILYILMGIASYLIFKINDEGFAGNRKMFLIVYFVQLVFNFFWTIIFFNMKQYYFAFGWLVVMWILILICIVQAFKMSKVAGWMLIPYILWSTFAGYLNLSIAIMN